MPKLGFRFWIAVASSILATGLVLVTLAVPDWIEVVSGVDPDAHSGILEAFVALGALTGAIGSTLACVEWRRVRARARFARLPDRVPSTE